MFFKVQAWGPWFTSCWKRSTWDLHVVPRRALIPTILPSATNEYVVMKIWKYSLKFKIYSCFHAQSKGSNTFQLMSKSGMILLLCLAASWTVVKNVLSVLVLYSVTHLRPTQTQMVAFSTRYTMSIFVCLFLNDGEVIFFFWEKIILDELKRKVEFILNN